MAANIQESESLFQPMQRDVEHVSRCTRNFLVVAASVVGVLVVGTSSLLFLRHGGDVGVPIAGELGGRGLGSEKSRREDWFQEQDKLEEDKRDLFDFYQKNIKKCKHEAQVDEEYWGCMIGTCILGDENDIVPWSEIEIEWFSCVKNKCLPELIKCGKTN